MLAKKIDQARKYADKVFPRHLLHVEIWSPYVPVGILTDWMERESAVRRKEGLDVRFVVNEDYAAAVADLVAIARTTTAVTGDDAFRMLQILTHLKGPSIW